MSVRDKVVVITGATRGIGRAVAQECARQEAHVVFCGRVEDTVVRTEQELCAAGPSAFGMVADVARFEQVDLLRDKALERYGRIDVWFNNAGVSLGYRPLDEIEPCELEHLVAVNLVGHVNGCRSILPYFRENGGYLMNMAGRGYKGDATPHTALYASTKTAIASLTRSLAKENADAAGVSVNGLVPGMVETDFYTDIRVSPRLEHAKDNWRFAMDAFGVPIETVAKETARLLGGTPGNETGRIYSLLTPARTARGIGKMMWFGMTGKMVREQSR